MFRRAKRENVDSLIVTASGGPLRTWDSDKIQTATAADCLRHPTWNMGNKITIDSASLFNKGLEVIEAHWLFGFDFDHIDVVVHPSKYCSFNDTNERWGYLSTNG